MTNNPLHGTALPNPDDLSLRECADWVLRAMVWTLPVDDPRTEFLRQLARRIKEFA